MERLVVELANAQRRAGHRTGIAAGPGRLWDEVDAGVARLPAPAHRGPALRLGYMGWLRAIVRRDGWTILHAHQRGVALLARIAVLGTGARVVEHVHNVFHDDSRLTRLLSFRGHALIACGSQVASMLIEHYRRPRRRIHLIRNGISDLGGSVSRALPGTRGATPRIVGIGRLVEQKNPVKFLDVLAALNASGLVAEGVWIGDGELRPSLEERLREHPVPGLRLIGQSDHVVEEILDGDLLLMTSRWEGLPLVLLECASLGRGAVVHDVGSCRDAVQPGVSGVLVPPDMAPGEIAERIRAIVTDPTELERLGAGARRLFLGWSSFDDMVRAINDVYFGLPRSSDALD